MPIEAAHANSTYVGFQLPHNGGSAQKNQLIGPFGQAALRVASYGFAVIPCGGPGDPSGKLPLVKWSTFKRRPASQTIRAWAARPEFRATNLGIITGLSGITVVDCDTPGCLLELFDMFGETPIVAATPGGGLHLYYRSSGERCGRFRIGDIKGDIKGRGGFVVAPPSARIEGGKVKAYRFFDGDWPMREVLPPIKDGAPGVEGKPRQVVALSSQPNTKRRCGGDADCNPTVSNVPLTRLDKTSRVKEGKRNPTLFSKLLQIAPHVTDEPALHAQAIQLNETFDPPLGLNEVRRTVQSVWGYKVKLRIFVQGGDSAFVARVGTFARLSSHPNGANALLLLGLLNFSFGAEPGKSFAISPKPMARHKLLAEWTAPRYREAIATLLETGLIRQVHQGGRRKGDPNLYVLSGGETSLDREAA